MEPLSEDKFTGDINENIGIIHRYVIFILPVSTTGRTQARKYYTNYGGLILLSKAIRSFLPGCTRLH